MALYVTRDPNKHAHVHALVYEATEASTTTSIAAGVNNSSNGTLGRTYELDMKKFRLGVKRRLYHECSDDLIVCGEDKNAIKQALAVLYDDIEKGYAYAAKRARQAISSKKE
jgi:hypothetical protein